MSYPDDTRRLLLRTFVAQPGCGTFVARLSWAVAELRNKLRKTLSADWSVVYYFWLCKEVVFFTLFYPLMSPNASFALISFFLHSLTKAPDDSTSGIKLTSSSVSLEAVFVARFVAAAFWPGCGQIFVAAASCATKVRNKSLRDCVIMVRFGDMCRINWRLPVSREPALSIEPFR